MSSDDEQKNILDREELEETNRMTETGDYNGTQGQKVDFQGVVLVQK